MKGANSTSLILNPTRRGSPLSAKWVNGSGTSEVKAKDTRLERKKLTSKTVLCVLIIEGQEAKFEAPDKKTWPKDPFEALIKCDWRQ